MKNGTAFEVDANEYAAREYFSGATTTPYNFGSYSVPILTAPTVDVSFDIWFIMKASGTGSNVRVAVRTKSKAVGENSDTSGAFDASDFQAVAIDYTPVGEVFKGTVTVDKTLFAAGDVAAFHIGRDGNNEFGAGTNDDANKRIQFIGILIR
jgi:hypothetical protein